MRTTRIAEWMSSPPIVIPPTTTLAAAKHVMEQRAVARHLVQAPHRARVPVAVAPRLRARRLEPVARELPNDQRVVQPSQLGKLVAEGAADGAEGAGPEGSVDELGEGVAGLGRALIGETRQQEHS